jgi:nitroreductase
MWSGNPNSASYSLLLEAPVVLVFCAHPARSEEKYAERGVTLYSVQDATIACAYATLAATALGLCCVWVGAFDPDKVRKIIGAPDGQIPVSMLPLGYPGKELQVRPRRLLKEIVHEVK